ncbi:hypothetical protein S40288_07661 [Stachybotrys chartarum IBT 40288]|nr:hypothetical protein S40288_07661 [Stachybotrys chartarum IBT 40288]
MEISKLRQVHFGTGPLGSDISPDLLAHQHKKLQKDLLSLCPAHLWHHASYDAGCPRPILIGKHHQVQLQNLHEALTIAVADIVERWWTDEDAQFPKRMPLEAAEEDLLKWLDGQVKQGNLPPFSESLGSWRPDFLVEDHPRRLGLENFSVTEINARFSFNGFMHEAYGQKALNDDLKNMGIRANGLVGATKPEAVFSLPGQSYLRARHNLLTRREILDGLFNLFDPKLPLHLLKGQEKGIDIHMFIDAVKRRFGATPRLITPADLRILADPQSKTGYQLCCLAGHFEDNPERQMISTIFTHQGEVLEEIHQVGLELHQCELIALEPEMLRQLSLRCFNDMRTILLVHDKRMLGIVRQELSAMVARQLLSPAQADALDHGVVETILAGSKELESLIQLSKETGAPKNDYILKPIRSGKGDGIVFGEDLDGDAWVTALERLSSAELISGSTSVVQRRIIPRGPTMPLTGGFWVLAHGVRVTGVLLPTIMTVEAPYSMADILAIARIHPFYDPDVLYPPDAATIRAIRELASKNPDAINFETQPFLWKSQLYRTVERLVNDTSASNTFRKGVYTSCTGGGTGSKPLLFVTDVHENRRHRAYFGSFLNKMGVIDEGDWVVTTHTEGELYRSLDLTLEIMENAGASVLAAGHHMSVAEVVQLINNYHANVLSGESSQIVQIVHYISTLCQEDRDSININKIIYTSEGLNPSQRTLVRAVFGPIKICSILGSAEAGPYAISSPDLVGQHHDVSHEDFVFDMRHTMIEILDPSFSEDEVNPARVQEGQKGLIVQTSLTRLRNPLVRYVTGDVGSLHTLPEAKRCMVSETDWEHLRVLRLYGRDRRFSFEWDANYIEFATLTKLLSQDTSGVLQWQVVLDKMEPSMECSLEVRLLCSNHTGLATFETNLVDRIETFFHVYHGNRHRFRIVFMKDSAGFKRSDTGRKIIQFINNFN